MIPFVNIDSNARCVNIGNGTCNDMNYTIFDIIRFQFVEELMIGSDSFLNIDTFKIDGLKSLRLLKIGMNSFTKYKGSWANNPSRSFHILNCDKLESIEIGRYSFSDYGGGFELKNLPKLSTIKIGEIGNDSSNFWDSSFVIKGIIDIIIANE